MIRIAALVFAGAAIAVAAPAAASERKVELQNFAFETCAKVLDGTISLDDPTQVAQLGFTPTPPRETPAGKLPRAEKGSGSEKVVISSGPGTCSIWFGGPDNPALAGGIMERAIADKLSGSRQPLRLGDGTMVFVFRDKATKRMVTMILADAGGELGFTPATTVIVMTEKD
jgi:hypothetical protein